MEYGKIDKFFVKYFLISFKRLTGQILKVVFEEFLKGETSNKKYFIEKSKVKKKRRNPGKPFYT